MTRTLSSSSRVSAEEPIPELARNLRLKRYYRCQVELGDAGTPGVIYAHAVPQAWAVDEPISERISSFGLFLKVSSDDDGSPRLVFAARAQLSG